ncbi:MAG: NAD(P)/FAD-dependent oxidoreductase [Candidatus Micrarchaeia archaeon]
MFVKNDDWIVMKKVIVVGAGPAGIFASYLLGKAGMNVVLVEMGEDIKERSEKIKDGGSTAAPHYIQGMGGSGTFSDGKINLDPEIGGNMLEFTSRSDAEKLIAYVDNVLVKNGVETKAEVNHKAEELRIKAMQAGIKYIPIKQKHVGSDHLPSVVQNIKREMENNGVEIKIKTKAKDLIIEDNKIKGLIVENSKEHEINADYVILAPGRAGSRWLLDLANKYCIKYEYGPLDIGVRVEVNNEVMEEVTSINWDPKFHITTKKYDDFIRTFCTNPKGFVITENYGDFVSVNGHSMKDKKSNNTNFALLVRVKLTEPVENTTLYGESIARLATTIGGGKPILQRLGDLKKGRRSTWDRIEKSYVEPTNKEVTPGDISMALPERIVNDIVEGLDMLSGVIPGVNQEHTLLYAPEIKFKSVRLDINKNMECKQIKNLFTVGDGAGVSGGIVTAAVTGLIAAREIIRRENLKCEI